MQWQYCMGCCRLLKQFTWFSKCHLFLRYLAKIHLFQSSSITGHTKSTRSTVHMMLLTLFGFKAEEFTSCMLHTSYLTKLVGQQQIVACGAGTRRWIECLSRPLQWAALCLNSTEYHRSTSSSLCAPSLRIGVEKGEFLSMNMSPTNDTFRTT